MHIIFISINKMLLQIKVYLIAILYFLGALFMMLFPPRNYEQSGTKMRKVRSVGEHLKYTKYIDYNSMLEIVKQLGAEDSEMVQVKYLTPYTSANNSIVALELHSDTQSRKPGILVIGTLNGMVWGASNAIIELAEKLLYDTNYQTPFFNDYDWYLIPIANPDALQFTKTQEDLVSIEPVQWSRNISARTFGRPNYWHKNFDRKSTQDKCFGTNINRNFAYHWQDDVRKSPDQCSQFYPGPKPFSTPEAQAIRTYMDKLGETIQLAIHLHASFIPKNEFILYPWRYTLRQQSNYRNLQTIGEYAARQARLPDGRFYQVHQASNDARVAGTLSDYLSGVVGTELVFLVRPYHQLYPSNTDVTVLETYVKKSITAILSLVRGWRRNSKQNTLSFFGNDVEF